MITRLDGARQAVLKLGDDTEKLVKGKCDNIEVMKNEIKKITAAQVSSES